MSAQANAELNLQQEFPDWGGGDDGINLDFSPRQILAGTVYSLGEAAWENRGRLLGLSMGLAVGTSIYRNLSTTALAQGISLDKGPISINPDDVEQWMQVGGKLLLPGILGAGNAWRVLKQRSSEKASAADTIKNGRDRVNQIKQAPEEAFAAEAAENGMLAEEYRAAAIKSLEDKVGIAKTTLSRLGLTRLVPEVTKEFAQAFLAVVGINGMIDFTIPAIWREINEATSQANELVLSLYATAFAYTTGSGLLVAWQTQDPSGRVGSRRENAIRLLENEGALPRQKGQKK